jgi:hypothetical protein
MWIVESVKRRIVYVLVVGGVERIYWIGEERTAIFVVLTGSD